MIDKGEITMEIVTKYKCDYCGTLLNNESDCIKHEERHKAIDLANDLLSDYKTLEEINDKTHIWEEVPEHLKNVTKDNCFIVSYWQCCNKPAYQITSIDFDGGIRLWGCGSWSGYYGQELYLHDTDLLNPRPKEELFIDPRYPKMNYMYRGK